MASGSMRKKTSSSNNISSSSKKSYLKPNTTMASVSTPFLSKHRRTISIFLVLVLLFFVIGVASISSSGWSVSGSNPPPVGLYSIKVVNEYPHDPRAFTQGLLYNGDDTLFESTGLNGQSSVRKVSLRTGKVESIHKLPYNSFGEGLTLIHDRLYQVTWREKIGFIYDLYNLSKVEKFTHHMTDGWGLATDGKVLYGSDGTSTLYQMNPQTLKVIRKNIVKYKGHEVFNLNELEYVNGEIWANVWQTDCIARISTKDGTILSWILLQKLRQGLITSGHHGIDVLNGIAWDKDKNRLFVTGKLWPKIYEIELLPTTNDAATRGDIENLCISRQIFF